MERRQGGQVADALQQTGLALAVGAAYHGQAGGQGEPTSDRSVPGVEQVNRRTVPGREVTAAGTECPTAAVIPGRKFAGLISRP